MATVDKTPANVHLLTVARSPISYIAGEALTAGNVVYLGSDNKVYKAKADAEATADAIGIVVSGGYNGAVNAGDVVDVAFDGLVSGFTGTPSTRVYVSATAGELDDAAPSSGYKFVIGKLTADGVFLKLSDEPTQV